MKKRHAMLGSVALLLVAGMAWWFGLFGTSDPAVAELQQMREEMFAGSNLPEAERQQLRDQFRQRLDTLTDQQRRALFAAGREQWMQRTERQLEEFFALAPSDQQKRLDEIINRMIERRSTRSQNGAGGGGSRSNSRGDGWRGRNTTEAQRDAWAKRRLDRSTPKQRAQRDAFRKQFEKCLEQRGIDPGSLPRRGGGRGWRGMT